MHRRLTQTLPGLTVVSIVVVTLAASGCSSDPPAAPTKANSTAAGTADSTGAATSSTAQSSSEGAATPQASASSTAKSTATSSTKPLPTPSPEQLAKWAISDDPPLQMLACYDGFGDSAVQCLALAPDGKQFVLGGAKLTLWNTATAQPTLDLLANYKSGEVERPILSVGIAPNGGWLAAGDHNGKLRMWELSDQSEVVSVQAHKGRLTQIAVSPDSQKLATTSYSGEVNVWRAADGTPIQTLKVDDQEVTGLLFISDTQLATAGREVDIWNVDSGTKESVLMKGTVIHPALGLSADRRRLAFSESETQIQFWDVEKAAATGSSLHGAASQIEFSADGKWIATVSGISQINVWNVARQSLAQVIDADGGRTVALKWLPDTNVLVIASEHGRVRFWGLPEAAKTLGIEPLPQPALAAVGAEAKRSLSSAQFQQIIDVRSFPQLPGAVPLWGDVGIVTYNAPASQPEAELFYRYVLGKWGWTETPSAGPAQPGLNFRKAGCELNVSMNPASFPTPGRDGDLQISLQFAGNYDVRWLPKISPIESKSTWSSFSSASYRTNVSPTDVEIALLKQFHEAGWTAYTRLNAAGAEDPLSRSISLLQGGSELTVSIGYPADSADELVVQTSVAISHKSLPIPPDAGWVEFDSSTDLLLVANTARNLEQTIEFFDKAMASDGWLAREAGRHIDEEKHEKAWLPYIRGQQDVLLRLAALPDGKTRIMVGDVERSSWQLQKPSATEKTAEQTGIEAADYELPKGARAVRFDVDQKKVEFELPDTAPQALAELFIQQMQSLDWTREGAGIMSDEYVFITFKKGKKEIQLRGRPDGKKATAMINGNGLLWSKPLPAPPVRISYETWLRRNHKPSNLDQLDEFAEEMHKIPASSGKSK